MRISDWSSDVCSSDLIQAHPAVRPETIHGFCWSLLQDFQPEIRALVPTLGGWTDRLAEADVADIGVRTIQYELGYPRVTETEVSLLHEDVLTLMTGLLARTKFRAVMTDRKSTRLNSSQQC